MKILLANPPAYIEIDKENERYFVRAGSRWPFSICKKKTQPISYKPFPFFLAYTSAILKNKNYQVYTIDSIPLNQHKEEFLEEVKNIQPDIIFFETSTPTFNMDISLIKEIKKFLPGVLITLGGPHVTAFPYESLKNNPIDFVFLQEYEISFSKFVDIWKEKPEKKRDNFVGIEGIAFIDEKGEMVINPPKLIEDINILPFPDRDGFPHYKFPDPTIYWDGFCQRTPAIQMHSSRGCPFKCNFCLWNHVMYGAGRWRGFEPKRVVDEMELVMEKYGAKEIYFDDDTFTGNKKHVLEICKEIKERKKQGKEFFWSAMCDAIVLDEEMLKEMAEAGCIGIKFGVESGSPQILKRINKPVNLEKVKKVTKLAAKYGIKTHATFSFGLSGETEKTLLETLKFAINLSTDSVQFSITVPFPGTPYYKELKEKGLLETEQWEMYDGNNYSVVRFENVKREKVEEIFKKSTRLWLLRKLLMPSWIFRQIRYLIRLAKWNGVKIIWERLKRVIQIILPLPK